MATLYWKWYNSDNSPNEVHMEQDNFFCVTCNRAVSARSASRHKSEMKHEVWHFDPSSNSLTEPYGKRKLPRGVRKTLGDIVGLPNKLKFDTDGQAYFQQHYKGYKPEKEPLVFILYPDGTVRDMRIYDPGLAVYYQVFKEKLNYNGTLPEFICDCVQSLIKNSGFEMALVPRSQGRIYEEAGRLVEEGKLNIKWVEGEAKLEIPKAKRRSRKPNPKRTGNKK